MWSPSHQQQQDYLELESGRATLKADFTNGAKITALRQNPLKVVLSEEEMGVTN